MRKGLLAKSNKDNNFTNTTTVICENTFINAGIIKSESSITIAGEYTGEIDIRGNLVVSESGKIKGNVSALSILVAGELNGNVNAQKQIQVTNKGTIIGDIICETIIVDEGALVEGHCKMKKRTDSYAELTEGISENSDY